MLNFYQHLPSLVNPIAFSIGSFQIRWYSLAYLVAFFVTYILIKWRIKKKEIGLSAEKTDNLFVYSIFGLLLGARLGYVLFYNFSYFWENPLEIFLPYNLADHQFMGIYGMSYFGGLIGIILAGLFFAKRNKINPHTNLGKKQLSDKKCSRDNEKKFGVGVNLWQLADWIVPAIPAGYFFGRIGNFLNGELYGRITDKFWGMYFPLDFGQNLRHPSQLYEAFFEGLVLFAILWFFRKKALFPGFLLSIYLFGYGIFRFFIEFVREPDPQIGLIFSFLTLGQIFSVFLILASGGIFFWKRKQKML